jgi:undecaprenyl phosphate N,N'-diacetylbacillosamine 1-phosphate transferase
MQVKAADVIRRTLDILVSLIVTVALSPFIILGALLVLITSPGPLFFRQARLGRYGHPFYLYKFRTMKVNAPDIRNADGSSFSSDRDPRLIPAGAFLRKTSIDELPQILNVLKGDMAIVGPRPEQTDQLGYYTAEERRRLDVRPGMTGLAQLSGRNSLSWKERKQLDLVYLQRRSIGYDSKLVLRTIPYVLFGMGRGVFQRNRPAEENPS